MAPEEAVEYEIDPKLQKELRRHPGKWVAVNGTRLVAVGDTPSVVYKEAKRRGVMSPAIYRVPEGKRTYFF